MIDGGTMPEAQMAAKVCRVKGDQPREPKAFTLLRLTRLHLCVVISGALGIRCR